METLYNNQKTNKDESNNLNLKTEINKNEEAEKQQYEKDLMINLHNVNMRRTSKSLIKQNDKTEKEFLSYNKKILFPSDKNNFKENIDENVFYNLKDKVPLI